MRRVLVLLPLAVLLGCGGSTVPVKGNVSGAADGLRPATTVVAGTVSLNENSDPHGGLAFQVDNMVCEGVGVFADVNKGATVTVYDTTGKIVGTGTLGTGANEEVDSSGHVGRCSFVFSASVTAGSVFQVQVGGHPRLTTGPHVAVTLTS